MINHKFLLAGAAAFLSLTTVANAGVINKGGFEVPDVANFVSYAGGSTDITGWTVTGNDVLLIDHTYYEERMSFNANGGSQSVDLTGAGNTGLEDGIWQAVETVIGRAYALSFFVGRADDTGAAVRNYEQPTTVDVSFDGGLNRLHFTNSDVTANGINWKQFTTYFTAISRSTVITFLNGTAPRPIGNQYAGLDDGELREVTLNPQAAGVPEPTSMAIFGIGAVVVGAGSYRRRRQQSRDC